jgi:hypothetical protein
LAFEARLNQDREKLEEHLNNKKKEQKRFIHQVRVAQKEIEELDIDIDFLSNYNKYTDMDERAHNSSFFEKNKKTKKKEDVQTFSIISKIQREARKRDDELHLKVNLIKKKEELKESLKKKINSLECEIETLRSHLSHVKSDLLEHYHSLLSEGRDTRNDGLVWIIKEVFYLGEKVMMSHLPNFLDEYCIVYLFQNAQISLQLEKIEEEKMVYKMHLKNKKESKTFEMFKTRKTFKTDLERSTNKKTSEKEVLLAKMKKKKSSTKKEDRGSLDYIKTIENPTYSNTIGKEPRVSNTSRNSHTFDLIERYKQEKIMDVEDFSLKSVETYLESKKENDKETNEYIRKITSLEKSGQKLKKSLEGLKSSLLYKLFKEFMTNDYERRFNVDKKVVLTALLGEEQTAQEIQKQTRDQRDYMEKLKQCRTFNIMDSINQRPQYKDGELHSWKGGKLVHPFANFSDILLINMEHELQMKIEKDRERELNQSYQSHYLNTK